MSIDKPKYNSEDLSNHHGVAAVIKNNKGEVLMQKHNKYGFWTIPVGKVHSDEGVVDALKTELKEECGVDITKYSEINFKVFRYVRRGIKVTVRAHLFEITKYKGKVKNLEPNKHKIQDYYTLDKIEKFSYLSDMTLLYLETLGVKRAAKLKNL